MDGQVPMLPPIQLYNTLTRQLEPLVPIAPPKVRLYVCGPTVYDDAHLGHARCYITWDVLYRFLEFMGYEVLYTRNVTDVDDKILNRAREQERNPETLAQEYYERFSRVMEKLNVKQPWKEPKATGFVSKTDNTHADPACQTDMVDFIQQLIEKGYAYPVSSGVYFDVMKYHQDFGYGALAHQNLDDLQSGARVEVDPEKRSPLDFALWKVAKDDDLAWDSPWGRGRPGWHLECSTMSLNLLGEQLDIHAGGLDLVFPHHQNEIAQSEALTGKRFVNIWMHNGFVNVSGEKMSKSLGNFSTVEKLLEHYDANTIRYFILTNHYRKPVDFNEEALEGAMRRAFKIMANVSAFLSAWGIQEHSITKPAREYILGLLESNQPEEAWEHHICNWLQAMRNDLNTAEALAALNEVLTLINKGECRDQKLALACFIVLSDEMGFNFIAENDIEEIREQLKELYSKLIQKFNNDEEVFEAFEAEWTAMRTLVMMIAGRKQLRSQKRWADSDFVRDALKGLNITIKDNADGSFTWHYEPNAATTSP